MRLWILSVIFMLSLVYSGYSQQYFSRRYEFNNYRNWNFSVNILQDSNSYILQQEGPVPGYSYYRRIGFQRLDLFGNPLGSFIIYQDTSNGISGGWGGSFIKLSDSSGYAFVGAKSTWVAEGRYDRGLLMRFNTNLDTIWSKEFTDFPPHDSSYMFWNLRQLEDKGFIIAGGYENVIGTDYLRIVLIRTDSSGNQNFKKVFGSGKNNFYVFDVIPSSDNGFICVGLKEPYSTCKQCVDPIVIKFDSLGTFKWIDDQFGNPNCCEDYIFVDIAKDGNIQVGTEYSDTCVQPQYDNYWARINLIKIRNDGSVVWNKKYGLDKAYLGLHKVKVLECGDIIAVGQYSYFDTIMSIDYSWMLRTDSAGNEKWYREYQLLQGDGSSNVLFNVIPTNDYGFIACGFVYPASLPDTGNPDSWVLKVDSLGCEAPNQCWVGMNEILIKTFTPEKPFVIYPNPTEGTTTIEFHENPDGAEIEISDQYGRILQRRRIAANKDQHQFDLQLFQKGLYFIRVRIGERSVTEKVMKL